MIRFQYRGMWVYPEDAETCAALIYELNRLDARDARDFWNDVMDYFIKEIYK